MRTRKAYKKLVSFFLGATAILFSVICSGCTMGLKSSNYWKGAQKEDAWVVKNLSQKGKSLPQTDERNYSIPVPAFEKEGNKKFRVGVVISGDYWEFFDNLKGLVEGISDIGWANSIMVPSNLAHCDELISWLNSKKYSNFVEFPHEFYVNLDWGDNIDEFKNKFTDNIPPLDAIIAYGGKAAKLFYDIENYPVPVLSDAVTDCYGAGITQSLKDSGRDFFTNKIDPSIYRQQVRLFHDMVGFKKLGIIYGDNEDGIIYGGVNDVEAVAKERGFEIVRNTNVKEYVDDDTADLYLAALRQIVTECDAVYIGASTAVTECDIMPQIVEILAEAKKPSFSLEGTIRVKDGILFSLSSSSGMKQSGIWVATKLSHIFAGQKPRLLPQEFESTASLAVNAATARKIGLKMPLDLLVNSDELYTDWKGTLLASASVAETPDFQTTLVPQRKNDSSKFRIAVVESGNYWEFLEHFKGIINGLRTIGWVRHTCDVSGCSSMTEIYDYLESEDYSNYIEFPRQYFVNVEWGEHSDRADFLFSSKKPDVDVVIGFGGVVGKLFTRTDDYAIPVLLDGITDPVGSGIIYSVNDSGRDFLTCRVDQTQYQRQIKLFHDLVDFKKLGIVYGNDEFGRLYGAVNDVELMALKIGFEIERNTNVRESVASDTVERYLAALKDVCSRSDAVYIGASTAVTEYNIMPQIVEILQEAGIPSFALEGDIRVKDGILLSVSSLEEEKIGLYNANKLASIFYGRVPRLLSQEFNGVPSIAMNIDMASAIGFNVPLSTLATVDQLYGEVLKK